MTKTLRILMLEDVPTDALLIERELRRAKIEFISSCVDTEEGFLRELRAFHPEVVLSDFALPQFDALEALRLLKRERLDLPFILVTGSQSEEVAVSCIKEGADDYILKSSLKRLPSAMLSALRKKEIEREREQAQLALRRSEEHFRSLIENASDVITVLDADGIVRYESASLERVLGYKPDELIGQKIFDYIHEEDRPVIVEKFSRSMRMPGSISTGQYRFRHRDGSWKVLETIGRNLLGNPQVAGLVANSRDITERVEAEEQIREQAALLDKAQDAIFVEDLEGRISFWNRSAARLYGWDPEEAIGRATSMLLEKADAPFPPEVRADLFEKGEWHGELYQQTKTDAAVVVESRWTLVRDSHGHPKSVLVINTDVTERKRLEAQFLRVQRMESIGTLAGGIAHDLNNVLTPLMVAVKMLRDEVGGRSGQEILDTLETSVHRGAGIVQQVLSFARGVEGERTLLQVKHPLAEVVAIAKETFPRSIQITSRIDKNLWPTLGNATQLHQIFMNLCVNARDSMPHGGRLHVEAENVVIDENYARMQADANPGRYVVITVSDSGTGIPPEVLPRIFEPFFTTKEVGKGTGLGLSTAAGIVRSHHGFMNVYSELGKGTRFRIYLPACAQVGGEREAPGAAPLPRGSGELILVADDELAIRDILRLTLQSHGYKVLTAVDGPEAVALCAQNKGQVKAAIVDVMMPFMDGPATIRALQKIDPGLRFVAVSGLSENRTAEPLEGAKISFLSKPFTTEQILTTLRGLFEEEPKEQASINAGPVS